MQMFLDDKSDVSVARRAQISQNSPYFDLGVGAERKERGGRVCLDCFCPFLQHLEVIDPTSCLEHTHEHTHTHTHIYTV